MVSWTCQRVVLNWPTLRSRGISRLRDATVRSQAAIRGKFCASCIPKAPRTGKAPLPGNISPPCIQNELTLARFARHVSEMPCKSPFGNTPREDLATKGSFRCTDPSNHARRANLAIPGCFVWVLRARRGEGCRRSACGSLCARRRGAFAGSSHAASSCLRSRARCSCCCACPRVRRARCPPHYSLR